MTPASFARAAVLRGGNDKLTWSEAAAAYTMDPAILAQAYLSAPYSAFIVEQSGMIVGCNRRAARVVAGLPDDQFEDLVGRHVDTAFALEPGEAMPLIREGAALGHVVLPFSSGTKSGKAQMRFRAGLVRAPAPGTYYIVLTQDHLQTVAQTLADRNRESAQAREREKMLSAQREKLSQSLQTMETFTNAASHDLRAPLGNLTSLLELFRSKYHDDLPDRAQQLLERMETSAHQVFGLSACLLDYAQASSGHIERFSVGLADALANAQNVLALDFEACGAELTIQGPNAVVQAEPILLENMLRNIFSNALKYRMPDRAPLVRAVIDQGSGATTLKISDNGQGFDPAKADRVFEAFERLDQKIDGNGIGLATCQEICRRHGWHIRADGIVNEGATFTIEIPHE